MKLLKTLMKLETGAIVVKETCIFLEKKGYSHLIYNVLTSWLPSTGSDSVDSFK